MNNFLIAICTPDSFRPSAKALITDLKKTNLASADLLILDNCYEPGFIHAEAMNAVLDYAQDQWVFFLDDDVRIRQPDWIETLVSAGDSKDAEVIGCVHTHPSGEVNHAGVIVHSDGSTELLRVVPDTPNYAAAVSSAVVAVRPGTELRFDTQFAKYQHDLDLCLDAWKRGLKVALIPTLSVVHEMAGYHSTLEPPAVAYQRDAAKFQAKWADFSRERLYQISELAGLAELAQSPNWEAAYNQASALRATDPAAAAVAFRKLISVCPVDHLLAGAHFHLFHLEGGKEHLVMCLELNPSHGKARELLNQPKT
jgi:GT2 family glycosyltransferase